MIKMKTRRLRWRSLTAWLCIGLLALGTSGCSGPEARRAEFRNHGWQLLKSGNYDKARVEFANALKIDAKDIDARYGAGQAAEKLEDFRTAAGQYRAAADTDPRTVPARVALARLMLFGGALADAEKLVAEILAIDARQADALVVRAGIALVRHDVTKASADTDSALAIDADNTNAISLKASFLLQASQPAQAIALLTSALARKPDNTELREVLAQIYFAQHQVPLAAAQFRQLIALQPAVRSHRIALSRLLTASGDWAGAEQTVRDAIKQLLHDDELKLALIGLLEAAKKPDEATRALQGFADAESSNFKLHAALARRYASLKRRDDAVGLLTKFIDDAGDGVQGMSARALLARIYLEGDDASRAKPLIDHVLQRNALDGGALFLRGTMALSAKHYDDAIADLRSALRDEPNNPEYLRMISRAYQGNGDGALAMQTLEQVAQLVPTDKESRERLAALHFAEGKPADAIPVLEDIQAHFPGDVGPVELVMQALAESSNWQLLQTRAEAFIVGHPQAAAGYYFRGLAAEGRKELGRAASDYAMALSRDPRATEPLTRLVRIHLAHKNYGAAHTILEQAIARAPDHALAQQMLGEVLFDEGRLADAKARFELAVRAQPGWWLPYRGLALLSRKQGDVDGAAAVYARGIAATPNAQLAEDLAALELQRGRVPVAIAQYRIALQRDPKSRVVANNLAMLLSTGDVPRASLDEAAKLIARLEGTDEPDQLDTIGWVRFRRAEHGQALQYLQRAAQLAPKSPVIAYHLALVQEALGQHGLAKSSVERALRGGEFSDRVAAQALLAKLAAS